MLHGLNEAVQFFPGFRFGGFHHQGAGHGEGHGGAVESVVHEPFGDVVHGEAGVVGEPARVQDAFMSYQTLVAGVEDREQAAEFFGDVVGVQDGNFRCLLEAVRTHHGQVHPADGGNGGAAPCRGGHGSFLIVQAEMAGQEGHKMFRHANGADAGTAPAMRHGKGFMEIQMADVCADAAGAGEAHLGIHVGSVHVHLAAVGMDDVAELSDGLFIDAVRGGVGDHDAGEAVPVGFCLGFEVVHVDVARFVAFDGDHLETGHGGGSGVRAVGGGGDEADVPVAFSRMLLVAADSQKPRIFPCRARVGLEGNGGKARDFRQTVRQGGEHFPDAFRFIEDVAVDWDNSWYLEAEPGDYITVARKAKGKNEWFVGGITDENSRTATIPFSWLPEGKQYIATIYEDGKDADWDTNPQSYRIRKVVVTPKSVLKQKLAASGGVAISIKEADKAEMKGLKTIR